ncbi:YciI family protein [Microbulbifer sp. EKSA008]|uniref:YciI family protein n=1 Tax=unclassified Microbulbifer TaxID=2619833 RepID=UPI0040392319
MFIILLKFSQNKAQAAQYMSGHKVWLQKGYDDGVFLASGNIKPGIGGGILAFNTTYEELLERISQDPFISENVVSSEVIEIDASKTSPQLEFLLNTETDG